jgi:hypothetical protein
MEVVMSLFRETIALAVFVAFVGMSHLLQQSVSVYEADCLEPRETIEIPNYTDDEIQEALFAGDLTAEMCVWMNDQHLDWQIVVER